MGTYQRLRVCGQVAFVVSLTGLAAGIAAAPAHAATTISVTTTATDTTVNGNCTWPEAVEAANSDKAVDKCPAGSGADTIIVPAGTYTMSPGNGLPHVTSAITMIGAGPSTILRNNVELAVDPGASLTISEFTVQGGYFGIYNAGALHMADMTVRDVNGPSGAINNGGTLSLVTSTLTHNTGWSTGGILNDRGSVIAVNDTITNNSAHWPGTAAPIGAGVQNRGGTFRGRNLTITGNVAIGYGEPDATETGGVNVNGGTVELANSIVAGNSVKRNTGGPLDCTRLYGQLTSLGYNLIQSTKGCKITGTLTGNVTGKASKLGPLAKNGGPTQTMLPLPGSPAIDRANPAAPGQQPALCPLLDQRSIPRPRDGDHNGVSRCDIGAVER